MDYIMERGRQSSQEIMSIKASFLKALCMEKAAINGQMVSCMR